MKYTDRLTSNKEYNRILKDISELEKDRIYCHHEISHALDVCRIAWIKYLESLSEIPDRETLESEKDMCYVAGLLHDIGRAMQYRTGEDHSKAGIAIASKILDEIDYPLDLKEKVLYIIDIHHDRDYDAQKLGPIGVCIRQADHLSRNCFLCDAWDTCKWKSNEKNLTVS